MKKNINIYVAVLISLLCTGCAPEQREEGSPEPRSVSETMQDSPVRFSSGPQIFIQHMQKGRLPGGAVALDDGDVSADFEVEQHLFAFYHETITTFHLSSPRLLIVLSHIRRGHGRFSPYSLSGFQRNRKSP